MPVTVPPKGSRGETFPRFLVEVGSRFTPGMFRRRPTNTRRPAPRETPPAGDSRRQDPARSGDAILGYLEDGPDAWLVIASLGGAARQPAWLHNLAKDPHATIEFFGGHRIEASRRAPSTGMMTRRRLEAGRGRGAEYVKYLSKTDREIPIVRLRKV